MVTRDARSAPPRPGPGGNGCPGAPRPRKFSTLPRPAPEKEGAAPPRPAPKITPGQESGQTFLHHQKFLVWGRTVLKAGKIVLDVWLPCSTSQRWFPLPILRSCNISFFEVTVTLALAQGVMPSGSTKPKVEVSRKIGINFC